MIFCLMYLCIQKYFMGKLVQSFPKYDATILHIDPPLALYLKTSEQTCIVIKQTKDIGGFSQYP